MNNHTLINRCREDFTKYEISYRGRSLQQLSPQRFIAQHLRHRHDLSVRWPQAFSGGDLWFAIEVIPTREFAVKKALERDLHHYHVWFPLEAKYKVYEHEGEISERFRVEAKVPRYIFVAMKSTWDRMHRDQWMHDAGYDRAHDAKHQCDERCRSATYHRRQISKMTLERRPSVLRVRYDRILSTRELIQWEQELTAPRSWEPYVGMPVRLTDAAGPSREGRLGTLVEWTTQDVVPTYKPVGPIQQRHLHVASRPTRRYYVRLSDGSNGTFTGDQVEPARFMPEARVALADGPYAGRLGQLASDHSYYLRVALADTHETVRVPIAHAVVVDVPETPTDYVQPATLFDRLDQLAGDLTDAFSQNDAPPEGLNDEEVVAWQKARAATMARLAETVPVWRTYGLTAPEASEVLLGVPYHDLDPEKRQVLHECLTIT